MVAECHRQIAVLVIAIACAVPTPAEEVVEKIDVDRVWSGHPVGFALLTRGDRQFVAYYDANRHMTVAARRLGETQWQKATLPEELGWDSHNYVTIAVDDAGFIHLSGNMHGRRLVYFRTTAPLNISTFKPAAMVGEREDRVTYPDFLPNIRGPEGELLFTYRDGSSGNGDQIFNMYDVKAQKWSRLLDTPLTSGGGKMNAYFYGPIKGPDGFAHMCWVWRDTGDCATNHDICYARSKDMVHWESATGKPLTLPMTIASADAIVDPVPIKAGLLNGNVKLGFDSHKRVIVTYHKFDPEGNTQIYNARIENGAWKIHLLTDWKYRWDFHGGGAIISEIHLSGATVGKDGALRISYTHKEYGAGTWRIDEETLKMLDLTKLPGLTATEIDDLESDSPEMSTRQSNDLGAGDNPNIRYVLQWETLGPNRDQPREGTPPPPTTLRVVALRK
ncbi:MAG: BNR repeat-containing protein [Candidatus Hydrogenedentes bacterium]|nr:BNR repeat-containing protein [Candidatus Hydrogenedentota bacterium]